MNFFSSNNINIPNQPINLLSKLNFCFGNIAFISLFIAVLLYWFDFFDKRQISKKLKNFCMIGANISLAFLLLVRWIESGHFPLSNLYESLIGLAWSFTSVHLIIVLNPIDFLNKISSKPFLNKKNRNVIETLHNNKLSQPNYSSSSFLNELNFSPTQTTHPSQKNLVSLKKSASNIDRWPSTSYASGAWEAPHVGSTSGACGASHAPLAPLTTLSLAGLEASTATSYKLGSEQSLLSKNSQLAKVNDKIGAITAPTALLTSVFATFFLPPEITQASALIPALKSNWLTMHVTVMVASYAFLLIGSLLSITYCVYRLSQFSNKSNDNNIIKSKLIRPSLSSKIGTQSKSNNTIQFLEKTFFYVRNTINYKNQGKNQLLTVPSMLNKQEEVKTMDNKKGLVGPSAWSNGPTSGPSAWSEGPTPSVGLKATHGLGDLKVNNHENTIATWLNTTSYRILGLGFPLLTIGILSGAVWANEAWGSYWSWDPKETWALITWLVFAVYFHSRYTRSSESFVPPTIASVGFIVIWICYLGVNLLGTGLHSYGWFSS